MKVGALALAVGLVAGSQPSWGQASVWYGPGENDDVDGGYYFAFYDPAALGGAGVAATWEGAGGYVAALPMSYEGPDATTRELVYGTPLPAFPLQTRILVTNTRTGQQVIVALAGFGPALWTGAAIALSADAKAAIGLSGATDTYVTYQLLPN